MVILVIMVILIQIVNAVLENWKDQVCQLDIVLLKILPITNFIVMSMLILVQTPNHLNVSTICIIHTKPVGINGQRDMLLQIVNVKNGTLNVNLNVILLKNLNQLVVIVK